MKPKFNQKTSEKGFTLIELLVVISIMALITGALVIDFSNQRSVRNIVIAKNETATNIRKVQNYLLSSRYITGTIPPKFYLLTFNKPNTYTIQAVDSSYNFYDNIENVTLPTGVTLSDLKIGSTSYQCLQFIYSAPFGTMYAYGSSSCGSGITSILRDPVQLAALSQNTSYVVFQGTVGDASGKYLIINPLTGQITPH